MTGTVAVLAPLKVEGLLASAEESGEGVSVHLSGSADLTTQEELNRFLQRVHKEALVRSVRTVEVDLVQLEFMNSSCFKTFLTWIHDLQQVEAPKRYHVTFLSNDRLHWQKRSLNALRCFAADLITVRQAR